MRLVLTLWSLLAYALFVVSIAVAVWFVGGGLDGGPAGGTAHAIVTDSMLLGLFAVQHSVMARPAFKRWWVRLVPAAAERSTFVLIASGLLLLIFWQWRPIPATAWRIDWAPAAAALWTLYGAGWLVALLSTFMIDHLQMFGLRDRNVAFRARWLYAWVRHPMMLGLLIAFWATPRMTWGHLLFATLASGYVFVGTLALEERDLRRELGDEYADYQRRVPAFFPRPTSSRTAKAG